MKFVGEQPCQLAKVPEGTRPLDSREIVRSRVAIAEQLVSGVEGDPSAGKEGLLFSALHFVPVNFNCGEGE